MWKNGKEGDAEGDESWKEKRGDGRRLKRKKKTEPRKGGGAARGTARTFGRGMRRSTVAHFARKVRATNT